MFGYLNIDKANATEGDRGLFGTFMCSLCLSTKNLFGNLKRLTISNDINLFNILFHSFLNEDVSITNGKCILSPFKERPLILPNALTDKLACANIVLIYFNLLDDLLDDKSSVKRIVVSSLKKSVVTARKRVEGFYQAVKFEYAALVDLERSCCKIIDRVCHPFAEISRKLAVEVLGKSSNSMLEELCYNLGKWVYLIDALDDLKKDADKKCYNPFLACFGYMSGESIDIFVKKNKEDLDFILYTTLYKIAQCFNDMKLSKYICILKNVFYVSIREKTQEVFNKYECCEANVKE